MKMNRNRNKSQNQQITTATRVTGDAVVYFILHNLISVFFFFLFTIRLEVYDATIMTFSDIFTLEFWGLVIIEVFFLSVVSGIIGRVGAYLSIKTYFYFRNQKRTKKKIMKRWGELHSGINEFNLIIFVLTSFITSLVYSLGVIAVLQNKIFDEESLLTLIGIYVMVKIGIYFLVRWIAKSKG